MAGDPYQELPRAKRRRLIFRAVLRGLLTTTVLIVLYYLLPLDRLWETDTAANASTGTASAAATPASPPSTPSSASPRSANPVDPAALVQRVLAIPPKRCKRALITFLTRPEIDALLAAPDRSGWIGRRDHALLLTAIQTGLRVSELTQLRCQDAELGTGAHLRCHGTGPGSGNPDPAGPRGQPRWPGCGARPWWSAGPATRSSTQPLSRILMAPIYLRVLVTAEPVSEVTADAAADAAHAAARAGTLSRPTA